MIIELTNTNSSEVAARALAARRSTGAASGLVMTLIVVSTTRQYSDAFDAAQATAVEHPSRIIVVIEGGRDRPTAMDAEIRVGEGAPGEVADAPRGGARLDEGEELLVEAAVDGRDEVRAQPVDEEGAQHAGRPVARPGGPGEGVEGLPVGPQDLGDDQLLRSELGADALETAQLVGRERRHVDALGQARGHGRRRREHLEVDEVGLRREAEELGAALGKIDGSRCAALVGTGLRCTPLGV